PGGKSKALTMSYDDGVQSDKRLVEIFNRYGIKGTFHLNAGLFGLESWQRLPESDIKKTYKGHEISAHGYTHQSLASIPDEGIISEIMRDREKLEEITGQPIRGMSYAMGSVSSHVVDVLHTLGMEYGRVVPTTGEFGLPDDFMMWHGTCHHNDNLLAYADKFLSQPWFQLMYVWGHSYEFDNDKNWNLMEEFCEKVSGRNDIWYATNIEILDYIKAVRGLKFTAKQDFALNQSATDVWVSVDGNPVEIKGGQLVQIGK
ncbi:MAG: polysaccharide deacetylase family protein, partial [Oscillospiraceae bacterium]|nr:polysaccharide deacetylase family protein [Oscillospiraceae bacterium]